MPSTVPAIPDPPTVEACARRAMALKANGDPPDCELICGLVGIFATNNGCENETTLELIAKCETLCGTCPVCED